MPPRAVQGAPGCRRAGPLVQARRGPPPPGSSDREGERDRGRRRPTGTGGVTGPHVEISRLRAGPTSRISMIRATSPHQAVAPPARPTWVRCCPARDAIRAWSTDTPRVPVEGYTEGGPGRDSLPARPEPRQMFRTAGRPGAWGATRTMERTTLSGGATDSSTTSPPAHCTMRAGRLSTIPSKTRRAVSWPASPGYVPMGVHSSRGSGVKLPPFVRRRLGWSPPPRTLGLPGARTASARLQPPPGPSEPPLAPSIRQPLSWSGPVFFPGAAATATVHCHGAIVPRSPHPTGTADARRLAGERGGRAVQG